MSAAARRLLLTLMGVGALVILLGYGFYQDPRYIPSPLVGGTAPDFSLELFNGETVRLSELRGKTVMLDFWASWCLPCRQEARDLEAAWKRQGDDVVFLGINIQDKKAAALEFIDEFGITFANGRDPDGAVSVDYGVWGIPEAFFISPAGRITYKHIGAIPPAVIEAKDPGGPARSRQHRQRPWRAPGHTMKARVSTAIWALILTLGLNVHADPALEDQVRAISSELRCVVCQNLSVADSPAEMAVQMRGIVREQLGGGQDPGRDPRLLRLQVRRMGPAGAAGSRFQSHRMDPALRRPARRTRLRAVVSSAMERPPEGRPGRAPGSGAAGAGPRRGRRRRGEAGTTAAGRGTAPPLPGPPGARLRP